MSQLEDQHVREATRAEAPLVSRLVRDSFADVAARFGLNQANCPTHPSNCEPQWIEQAMDRGARFFICRDGHGRAIGCAAIEAARDKDGVHYLERVAVMPEHRCRGVGRLVVRRAIHEAGQAGSRRIELAMIADHTELRIWYEKLGFVATRTARFPNLPFAVLFMGKDLWQLPT